MQWEEVTRKAHALGTTPESVFREETQKAILSFLSRKGFFREGVFQGEPRYAFSTALPASQRT